MNSSVSRSLPTSCRYSTAFKLHVIEEIESGSLTETGARRKYGIAGAWTVRSWLKKYGREHLIAKVVRVEHPTERDRLKVLEARNRELESALAQSQVMILALESLVEVAEEHYQTDFKKNFGQKQSGGDDSVQRKNS